MLPQNTPDGSFFCRIHAGTHIVVHLFRMLPLLKVYNDLITAVASREGKLSWKSLMYCMAAFDRDLTRGGPLYGRL